MSRDATCRRISNTRHEIDRFDDGLEDDAIISGRTTTYADGPVLPDRLERTTIRVYNCGPHTHVDKGHDEEKSGIRYNIGSFADVHVYSNHTGLKRMSRTLYDTGVFSGACVDSGAEVSVVGKAQADAYGRQTCQRLKWKPSALSFKFGSHVCRSLGRINVRMPTPDGSYVEFTPDVVEADVPLLIGLDLLEEHGMILDFSTKVISNRQRNWKLPMKFKNGHIFIEWGPKEVCLTKAELQRLHLHFFILQQISCSIW